MSRIRPLFHSSGRLILLAFGLSVVMAVELAASNGFLRVTLEGKLPWQSGGLVALMILASTGAIMSAFSATLRPDPARIASTLASAAMAMVAGVEASHHITKLPPLFYFGTTIVGQALFTYCLVVQIVALLRISGKWATQPPFIATGVILLFGAIGFVGQSWMPLEVMTARLIVARDVILIAAPVALLALCTFYAPLRLDKKSQKASLLLRLPSGKEFARERRTLAIIGAGLLVSIACDFLLGFTGLGQDSDLGLAAFSVISLGWIGILRLSVDELALFTGEQRQGHVTAKLATVSAKRFLRRHLLEKQAWAATVGLKTTNFSIDHDPGSFLESHLPASIMQIRAEEIQRCVSEVLGGLYLHGHFVGHRIFGALDPETSVRPCVDTLKMFACLYLDAGPLVERRIKGLISLLPIVDPGLARLLRPEDISNLIKRNLWFFHYDFGWIDQAVIHTPRSTRYDVRIATLSSRMRHAMMAYLEKTGGVGNFVWIGPDARDRLLQEAPALKNVIEACPIPNAGGKDELLMFIIKFEQLIPRLQRYFDLDSMRKALLDFEPSQESARLQGLLSLEIDRAHTSDEILEVLASVTSVPWRGFKEKDGALQLVLQAFKALNKKHSKVGGIADAQDAKLRVLHDRVLDAVRMVGYPSQVLHHAHMNKIALRDVGVLRGVAIDPVNPRFQEAWMLMGATDYSRYDLDRRREMLVFLKQASTKAALRDERLVQIKAVDTLASVGRAIDGLAPEELAGALSNIGMWFAAAAVEPDVLCLLLDAQAFLSTQHIAGVHFDDRAVGALDKYVQSLGSELGAHHPQLVSIMSRWQDIRTRASVSPQQAA